MKNIAIFASGKGSNADNICAFFRNNEKIGVSLIVSDRKLAGVFDVAAKHHIQALYINRDGWQQPGELLDQLKKHNISLIVLAGFLKLIPPALIKEYPKQIINIHPALLPRYGGQGMYGSFVHDAVYKAGDKESGITIHYVDEHYDEGDIIFQATVSLNPGDNSETIAARIHTLEMKHYPAIIEMLLKD